MVYTIIFSIILIFGMTSCINPYSNEKFPVEVNLDNQTTTYRRDKASIERTYMDNIESVRLVRLQQEGYKVNQDSINPEIASEYGLYNIYALRDRNDYKRVASPVSTKDRISLVADTITYSQDSLFCVALMIIKVKNDNNPNFVAIKDSCYYDGRAVIGMRNKNNASFYLFPIDALLTSGTSYSMVRNYLRNFYFDRIAGFSSWDGEYKCGIGDPEFFTSAPEFKKDSLGFYLFESFTDMGKRYLYYNYKE